MVRSRVTRAAATRPLKSCSFARPGAGTTTIERRSCLPWPVSGHAQGHAPHRHHHGRHVSTALLVGTLEALAVDCQDGSASTRTERLAKRLHKAGKRILQRDRIEHAQHPTERIMAGNAVLEFKDSPKKISLLDTELCYLDARFRPAKHSSKSDEQHFAQVMACIDIARIRYRLKYNEEIAHPSAPKNYQDIRKNPYFNESQGPVYSHAIPLGFTRVGWRGEENGGQCAD